MEDEPKDNIVDLSAEIADVITDKVIQDSIFGEIPVLGWGVKIARIGGTIQNALFMKKIERFLNTDLQVSKKEREKFQERMANNPKEQKKIGEVLLLLLERYNDFEKVEIMAFMFAALLREEITLEEFRRLGQAIDMAYVEDLQNLMSEDEHFIYLWGQVILSHLVPTGLTVFRKDLKERRLFFAAEGQEPKEERRARMFKIVGPFANLPDNDIFLTGLGGLYFDIMTNARKGKSKD